MLMAGDDVGPQVLIVEDDQDMLFAFEQMFRRAGYRVVTERNGAAALTLAWQLRPNLLVLDVDLPDLSGLQVCRTVRANPDLRTVAVLLVSGWAWPGDLAAGRDAGADDYITKPFTNRDLLARAATLLAERASPEQASS